MNNSGRHKVLFLASWFPNRLDPFLGNFVERHALAVSEYADVASLFVCSDSNLKGKKIDIEIKSEGGVFSVNVYYKKIRNSIPVISQMQKFLRNRKAHDIGYKKIQKHFSGHPDIVHLNVAFPSGLFAMRLKKKFNLPYILTEHSTLYHLYMSTKESHFTKKICNESKLICPVSNDLRKVMEKKGFGKKFEVVSNVVDTDLFQISKNKKREKKKILHISTLKDWQKNVSGMLRVIKKLSETRNDFELHIISDGDLALATKLSEEYNLLGTAIFIYPEQPIEKIAEMMRESDFFLLFSNFENLPCVIIEALASGIPIVSSNVGGIPELVNEKNGMLVNPKDDSALFDKINSMLDKFNAYDKNELRKFAVDNFSYSVVGKKFCDIYTRFIK